MMRRINPGIALLFSLLFSFPLVAQEATPTPTPPLENPFEFRFRDGASLKLFGRFEMLTYYDTTSPAVSDWLAYVYPEGTIAGEEDSFSMSVRGSPFGFSFQKPRFAGEVALNARLEMDFVGGFTTGTNGVYSPLVRLKQVWFSLDGEHLSILVGQSFSVFGPLFPDVGSWIALGTSGNPWIRLPQLRFTAKYSPVKFELSLNRPMGANELRTNSVDDVISDGEMSNLPFTMGRISRATQLGSVTLETGAAGVYGRERIRRSDAAAGISVDTTVPVWMGVFDLSVGSKYVDFKGEFFGGSNLNTFYSGILQGVNVGTNDAETIRTVGGWGQFTLKPPGPVFVNLGAGIDNPKNGDLVAGTQRSFNFMGFANANYRLAPSLVLTFEPSYMRTGYVDGSTNANFRGMFKTVLSF